LARWAVPSKFATHQSNYPDSAHFIPKFTLMDFEKFIEISPRAAETP